MRRYLEFFKRPWRHTILICLVILIASLSTPAIAVAELPVVIAVDTSRSLSTSELKATTSKVDEILAGLAAETPIGLLAFNDSPQWIVEVPATKAVVEKAMADLIPAGNFTLLNDALFTTARALPDGGVIMLLTDGRDENSATTVEDVAGLCRANHVRIIASGAGHHVDERALRRLAMLSDGAKLSHIKTVDPTKVLAAIETASRATTSELRTPRPSSSTQELVGAPPEAMPPTFSLPPREKGAAPWWLLPLLALLIVGVLAILASLVMLGRRRGPLAPDSADSGQWDTDPNLVPDELHRSANAPAIDLPPAPPMDENVDELTLDPSAFERLPFNGDIDATNVLDEQHILCFLEAGKEARSFRLRPDRAFAVGRAPGVNTISLDSRALSSQHFKLVPHEGGFAVVDLDSTNGTLVNGQKIRAHHLKAGDRIRAGELEFEFKIVLTSPF